MKLVGLLFLATLSFASMEAIERSPFGKTLSETIQLQLKLQGGVEKVIDLIWALDAAIGQEQADHDAEYAATKAECEATLADYAAKIAKAQDDARVAQADLDYNIPLLNQTKEDLAAARTDLANKEREKADAERQREEEKQEYDLRVFEHEAALKACDDASALVAQMYAGNTTGTFLQKRPVLVQVASHVQAVRKVAPSFAPILKNLVQIAASPQADQSKVGRILELIDGLKGRLEDSLQLEHDNEAAAIAAFNAFIDQITKVISDLKADIARLEADEIMYQAAVDDATMRLDDANRREEENTKLWNEKNDICNAYYDHYASETERRDEERAVCKEAAELLEESFADTSDYVMSKVEHVE